MKNWQKELSGIRSKEQIIEVDRKPEIEDKIEGYVVGVSELFVMLHALDPDYINLNGYIVLRTEDIRRYRVRDDNSFFVNRALKIKGIEPKAQPEIDLSSFASLLESANARFSLVTLHREIMDEETCFIGRVERLTEKTITLKEIDAAARWERTRRYNFKDITRIDFGGAYEDALMLVAEHESSTR